MLVNSKFLFLLAFFSICSCYATEKDVRAPLKQPCMKQRGTPEIQTYSVTLAGVRYDTSYTVKRSKITYFRSIGNGSDQISHTTNRVKMRYETTHVGSNGQMVCDNTPDSFEFIKALALQPWLLNRIKTQE